MRSRLAQLAGEFTDAVKSYNNVRGRSMELLHYEPPAAIRSIHTRAIDDAYFWTALCQFEQGRFQPAADTLGKYRKRAERAEPGNWMRESRYLRALSLAATGDHAAAIRELEAVEPDDPEYAGYRLLIRQWREAGVKPDP
jgi:Flp pilus assembly protein TadD